jgi:hypothetical protein
MNICVCGFARPMDFMKNAFDPVHVQKWYNINKRIIYGTPTHAEKETRKKKRDKQGNIEKSQEYKWGLTRKGLWVLNIFYGIFFSTFYIYFSWNIYCINRLFSFCQTNV